MSGLVGPIGHEWLGLSRAHGGRAGYTKAKKRHPEPDSPRYQSANSLHPAQKAVVSGVCQYHGVQRDATHGPNPIAATTQDLLPLLPVVRWSWGEWGPEGYLASLVVVFINFAVRDTRK